MLDKTGVWFWILDHKVDVVVVAVGEREPVDGFLKLLELVVVGRTAFIVVIFI